MTRKNCIAWVAALAALIGLYDLSLPVAQAEDAPKAVSAGEAENPAKAGEEATKTPPRSPIRIKTVEFEEKGDGPGKLKLAGTAAPGTMVYIFVDQDPYVKLLADEQGNWSVEGDLVLTGDRHMLRAEQYDQDTRMLAGRAMVTISRNNKANVEP